MNIKENYMSDNATITETLLEGILNGDESTNIEPATRKEMILAGILRGDTECNIDPATREEALLKAILLKGTGSESKLPAVLDGSVTSITAEDMGDITELRVYALSDCTSLTSVEFPVGIELIPNYFCSRCSALTSVTIPEGVKQINASAFTECGLTEVTLPSTVKQINTKAFFGCADLVSLTVLATTPPTLGNVNAFGSENEHFKIYVPSDSVATYKAADKWSTYANIIEEIPEEE